ncbi:hypothetical protein A7K93_10030 [Candidatus Methylacidiphilum fumarolicum]|uniref:Uncharacterized protein n=2 Tax=Candidatus Methylacidiphilum fumarolicum TaxID=591154 RepID=I0K085_METFB|nr:hypothetical protein A7K73_03780 [Candidatus Methylacidiphilum fumarolicum]CCG92904.1 hypothetical protein MFUM_830010 [Methylacidiphilum fumariolicum SolV]TFE71887.1 hypothetical protein A7K93_10030 [Candidatus Methylacidiphilum fumarolicum]TFE71936.1 hypothetical protein A7K72_09820 [Candidatus Methylacidiphilum fumarolicum]TFE75123.1 hypothetical protein A7D33_11000 [Candidatus Methylacidiphilum fumarolicum]
MSYLDSPAFSIASRLFFYIGTNRKEGVGKQGRIERNFLASLPAQERDLPIHDGDFGFIGLAKLLGAIRRRTGLASPVDDHEARRSCPIPSYPSEVRKFFL